MRQDLEVPGFNFKRALYLVRVVLDECTLMNQQLHLYKLWGKKYSKGIEVEQFKNIDLPTPPKGRWAEKWNHHVK